VTSGRSYAVVIPTYDGGDLVLETVRSVVEQTRPPEQIVVVDDGSTDGSAARIRERFADDTIEIVTTENRGRSAARNLGLAKATQPFVCFLDHDDLWHRDKLARTDAYLDAHPDCVALRNPVWFFAHEPGAATAFYLQRDFVAADLDECHREAEAHPEPVNDFDYLDIRGRDMPLMYERCRGINSSTVVSRELAVLAGGYPVYASGGEDWMFFLQVARFAEWHTLPEPLGFSRFHAGQGTTNRADALGVLAVKVAAWYGGRPFPEQRPPKVMRHALESYGDAYADEVRDHLRAALRDRDLAAARTIARLAALLLPRWGDRARALQLPRPPRGRARTGSGATP
jgi:glycosyltransferase involved in cell wall biosynthesis